MLSIPEATQGWPLQRGYEPLGSRASRIVCRSNFGGESRMLVVRLGFYLPRLRGR
jgi:hypothetical protein